MFDFLKKTPAVTKKNETVTLQLSGLHCSSCSLTIDGTLEDIPGVVQASTSYAKSQSVIIFEPEKVTVEVLKKTIINLGYQVEDTSVTNTSR